MLDGRRRQCYDIVRRPLPEQQHIGGNRGTMESDSAEILRCSEWIKNGKFEKVRPPRPEAVNIYFLSTRYTYVAGVHSVAGLHVGAKRVNIV